MERAVRLLGCEFLVILDDDRLADRLDRLVQRADQEGSATAHHGFEIRRAEDGCRIIENGREAGLQPDADAAAFFVCRRMQHIALAAVPGYARIHAGCATWNGRRFLAVGPPESGKTTLMIRLLYEGFDVHGDEMVLVRDGLALPYPRRFGVRPPTFTLIPELGPRLARPPSADAVVPLDPLALGFGWRIAPAPVAAIFFLEPNHGGRTERLGCARHVMAQRIMAHSSGPAGGAGTWIAEVCAILATAQCHILRVGNLDTAVVEITKALSGSVSDG